MCCLLNKISLEKLSNHQLSLELDELICELVIKPLNPPYTLILYTFYTLFLLVLIIIFGVIALISKQLQKQMIGFSRTGWEISYSFSVSFLFCS